MHLRIHTLRIKLLIGFLLSCFAMQAQVPVPFTIRYQDNIKGDITQISNGIVNRYEPEETDWECTGPWWDRDCFEVVTGPPTLPTVPYDGNTANDNFDMRYIDVDGDAATFSSSSATLSSVVNDGCSEVVYAGLYWSATYKYNTDSSSSGRATDFNEIKLKLPGSVTYTDITGTVIFDGFGTADFDSNSPYACYADVTALVAGLADPNGEYTVANIRASEANLSGGVSGGWTLFVVYENPNKPGKYVTSYDGFAGVNSGLGSIDVNYSGFTTVPAPLPVRAKLMACALEGDKGINGDQLRFKESTAGTFSQLSNTQNPATNFFNGSISYLDATDNPQQFTDRVPNSSNTLGYDADIINIPNGLLSNGATAATLRIMSTQDTYYMFFNALSVDIIEPEIRLIKTVEDLAGNDIGGADVTLGDYLEYVINFQNIGNDDATGFTITDVLPVNTFFNQIDVSGAPGVTYVHDPVTGQVTFTIPDGLIEQNDPAYEIRLRVRVVETCSELTDACSNIIQNTAYSTYQGVLNSNVISNNPSVAGVNSCGLPLTGPANFLVDIDDCTFEREVVLCGTSVTLTAGDGYVAYTWYDSANNEIGNTQSIVVNAVGQYHVVNTAAPGCVGITEYVNVVLQGATQTNPIVAFADEVAECPNDGADLPYIFLCGINDTQLIQTGILDADNIIWEKLNDGSCTVTAPDDCANNHPTCTWTQVGTGPDFEAALAGEYRLVVNYQNGCFSRFYFNVYANLLDPQYTREHILCTSDGEIAVTNVPAGYEYQLIDQSTSTVLVPYQSNPVFPITTSGIYTVQLRQVGVTDGCVFELEDIGIQNRILDVNVIIQDATCDGLGSIRLQALNVGPQYYFTITGPGGVNISHGPVTDNNHLFDNLNPGSYIYTVTTDDGCTETDTIIINDYSNVQLTATVTQNISCSSGFIDLNPTGGLAPYSFAVYSIDGILENPVPGDYIIGDPAEIALGDEGTYVFITQDFNGCTAISNPVIIENLPSIDYTTNFENVSCNGANDGSITYTVNNANGFGVAFEIFNVATPGDIVTSASGVFTGLAPGTYTVNLIQQGTEECRYPTDFTITEPTALTGTASVTDAYNCINGGATITINPASVTGGAAPYEYSIDGITFGTATTFTGLTEGTYNVTIRDGNNCTFTINTFTINPLTPPTDITFNATAQTCPALTSDVTLTITGGTGPFNYQITAPAGAVHDNGTSAVFTGIAAGTYTFEVTDANGCAFSENYTINAITPITVNGQAVNDVTCFGAADGSLNFNIGGFSTNYSYSVLNGASAIVSSSASATGTTIPLTNLPAETYTITVTDNVTNCTANAAVTINGPVSALTVSNTALPITCNADGSVTVTASGGWGSYEYGLEYPGGTVVGPQSGSLFAGLTETGTYTISVTDANNCTVTNTFTLTAPVPPVASVDAVSDICYDAGGASITVTVTGGQAPLTYSLNGAPAQASNVFNNLLPGTYTITVTDAYGCTDATASQTIGQQLTAMASLEKGLDCTASPGADIEVTIGGGIAPYTYEVSFNGGAYSVAVATISPFTYTTAANADGTYQFRITDANNCTVLSNVITVQPLTNPAITSVTPTNILCNGQSTGAITVSIDTTMGVGPYVVNIYNTTLSQDFGTQTTGLPAGDYDITVTDANSCTATQTVTVTQPDAINFNTAELPITCDASGVSAGQITVETITGGVGPYTYYLSNNFGYSDTYTAASGEDHSFQVLDYGIYQVVIEDANGCTLAEQNIIMASPPEDMDIDISTLTSDCTTGGTAVVTVNPDVSSNDYSFAVLTTFNNPDDIPPGDWQPADGGTPLTSTFTGLIPGVTYTFVVRDNITGCYYIKSATQPIDTLSTLTSAIDIVNNVSCTGSANGTVSFTIDNYDAATTQVDYVVYHAQSNQPTAVTGSTPVTSGPVTINNLGPLDTGSYFILFTEVDGANAGCTSASVQFTITESVTIVEVSATVTQNDNCGTNAGIVTATAQFGTAPYEFIMLPSLDPAPTAATAGWDSDGVFNAEAGSYTVYVKDAYNCIQPTAAPVILNADPEPVIALSVVQQCNTAEGSFSIEVNRTTNGIAPYTYSFNGGAFQPQAANPFTYNALVSGTYTVEIRDANGCTNQQSITIYPPVNLSPAATAQPTCADNDGTITVTGIGGSGTYEYELQDSSNVTLIAAQPSNIFTGQASGNYIVVIHDTASGCTAEASVTLEAATPVIFTATPQHVSCFGGSNGTITVNLPASNNNPVYTYTLDDGVNPVVVQNSPVFTGLAAGFYDITVTSGKNCTDTQTVEITEPAVLDVSATATEFACDASNTVSIVTLTATGAGGTAPFTYSIDGTNFFTSNTFDVADTGAAQNITVTIRDANNCTDTYPITINPLPEIASVAATQLTAITCTNDETVTITVTGGSGDFTFELLPTGSQPVETPGAGVQTADFDLTAPGSYTFQVTDNETGCYMITIPYEILPYDTIEVTASAATDVTCFGDTDGTFTINVAGYTGNYNYEVFTSGGTSVATGTANTSANPLVITGLPAGNHYVTVTATDSPFCTADSNTITIPSPANALTLSAAQTASVTCDNNLGEITAVATGGWGTYEFELVNNTTAATIQAYAANGTFVGLPAGNYTVSVRDAGGCIVSQTIDLVQPPFINADIDAVGLALLCNGDNTATVSVINVTGGEGVYQYILNTYDATGTTVVLSSGAQTGTSFTNLGAGIYSITVTDGWNCDFTTPTVEVTEPTPVMGFLSLSTALTCTANAELTLSASGGVPPYTYSTDGVTYTATNVYSVTAGTYQYYAQDSRGCGTVLTNEVTVLPVPPLTLNLDLSAAAINCFGESTAEITADATGGLGNYQYELYDSATNTLLQGPQIDETFSGLASGNYYVHVISGDCEETSGVITITEPILFDVNAVKMDVVCWNENNGSITINTLSPGTGTIQYAISPNLNQFDTENSFTSLAPGWYEVIAQDQNGCFEFFQIEIIEPAKLEATVTSSISELCYGDATGEVTIEITGGTGSYEASIDGTTYVPVTGSTHTFTGLTTTDLVDSTLFTISVRDSNGCDLTPPLEHWVLPPVDIQPAIEPIVYNCSSNVPGNEVTVTVNPALDPADLEYSLNGGAYQASNIFNDVPVGTHTVNVQHTNGCIDTVTFDIENRDPIAATAAVTADVLCFGEATGEITATVTAGTAPYEYAISTDPANFGPSNVFTGLTAGTYTITVRDAIGCELTTTAVTVIEPTAALTASEAITHEICLGANDGTVTVTINGGTSPYFTSLNGAAPIQDQFTYAGLAPGSYTIAVTDANGCAVAPITFTINPGVDIQAVAEATIYNCTGNIPGNTTTITVNTALSADVQYSLDGTAYQPSNVFTNLTVGTHTVNVQHTNGCIDTVTFDIENRDPIAATAAVTADVLCFGEATGEITATVTSGTAPYEYAISTDPANFGPSNVFTGLTAGTYTITVRDAIGCELTTTAVTVGEPTAALTASEAITHEICLGANDGTVTVTINGGTSPYFTSLNGAAPIQDQFTYTGLAPGNYTIAVTDANGCAVAPIAFTIDSGININPIADVQPTCTGNTPGNLVFVLFGGTPVEELQFSLDGVTYQADNVFVDLAPGDYTVYVQHDNGCVQTDDFTITASPAIAATAAVTADVLCFGEATGEITATVTAGTAPYEYAISTDPANFVTSNLFTGLTAGTYTIIVRDAIGCELTTTAVTVNEPAAALTASEAVTHEICLGANDGTVTVTAGGGTSPYFTSLNGAAPIQDQFTYTGLAPGNYTIAVTDTNGCAVAPISFTINPGVDIQAVAETTIYSCTGNTPNNETTITVNPVLAADVQYSLDNGAYQASNVFTNLAVGTHTVDVQHTNGCIDTVTFDIDDHQPITIDPAITIKDVFCFGEATGEITVTATGGTSPLEYAISPGFAYQSSNLFTGLTAGTYTVRVRDAIGCIAETAVITIGQPTAALAASVLPTHEICLDANDGTVTVSVTDGTGPYETMLDSTDPANFASVFTYTGLTPGSHTVYVRDANNCEYAPITFTINPGVDIQAVAEATIYSCTGNTPNNETTITVNPVLAADVQYSLDNGAYQPSNVFTNLSVGTHTVDVQHTNGCIDTVSFDIENRDPIAATAAVTADVLCFGEATGEITATVTAGTGPYEYAISTDPANFVTSNLFTGLAAGTYTITVRDDIGCEFEITDITVNEPAAALTALEAITHEICLGANDGTVTVSVTDGTGPYETMLDSTDPANFAAVFTYTGLTPGDHTVYVRDANNCEYAPITFTINPGVDIQAVAEATIYNCTGNVPGNTTTVTVNTALSADVQYSLDGTAYQPSNVFTNLTVGTHTVDVQHTNGCIDTVTFDIENRDPIAATAAVTADVLCFGEATGEITATVTSGTAPYTYAISTDPVNFGLSNVFTGLTAGTYTITVRDAIGCELTTTAVTVNEPAAALTASEAITHEICLGANDGTVTVTAGGGTSPYFTSLNGAAPIQDQFTYNSLAPGNYTIAVTDANGCAVAPITFTINPGVSISPVAEVQPTCTGNTPGNVVFINVNPAVLADVQYSLDGVTYQTDNYFVDLAPGSYTVYVQHTNGCVQTDDFTITASPAIAATAAVTADVLCFGEATGEITATVTAGTGPYEYAISTDPANFVTSNLFTGLTAGTYTITVQDAIGCEFTTTAVTIIEPTAALAASETLTDEICLGANDGTVTVTVTGGTAPYFTSLNGAAPVQDQFTYTNLAPGSYTIAVTDTNSCAVAPIAFTINAGVDIQAVAEATIYNCTGNVPGNTTTVTVNTAVAADVQYSLDNGAYQPSNVFTNLAVGTHTVDVQHTNGCIGTVSFDIDDHQPIAIDPVITIKDVFCFGEATGEITVTATGGTSPLEYAISPGFAYQSSNLFTGLTAGTYTVRVRDAIGCIAETAVITIDEPTAALAASVLLTHEICLGANDGTVTVSVTDGTGPYETMLDSTDPANFAAVFTYTGLTPGSHTVYVRDANNCEYAPITFTINAGVDIQAVAEATIYNCTGNIPGNTTTVTVNAAVAADVQYSLDNGAYQASNVFTNLAVGTHTVDVQHTNGCIGTVSFDIEDHQPIAIDSAVVTADVLCFGEATGEITVTASGGTTPLEYAISPDFVYGTANTFTGLAAGTYTVRVRDAIGCMAETAVLTITEPAAGLNVASTVINESCIGLQDGFITLTVSGGTAPYFTSLNSDNPADFAQDVFNYNNLAAGDYTIYVTDANGCEFTPIDFTIAPGVDIQAAVQPTIYSCTGNIPNNETIVNVNPAIAADVQYSLNGGAYQASNVFTNLAVGTHTVDVLHVSGCISNVTFDIEDHQPIAIDPAVAITDVHCFGEATGEIAVTATGGTSPLEYAISPDFAYGASNAFTGLTAGTYTVRVRDAIGCIAETAAIIVNEPASALDVTFASANATCTGLADGSLTLTVNGGTAPYFTSLNSNNPTDFAQDVFVYNNLAGGNYTVYVKDANGCEFIPIDFTIDPGIDIQAAVQPTVYSCTGNVPGNETTVTVNPAIAPDVQYSLDGGAYQPSNVFTNLAAGTHTVDVQHVNGCIETITFDIEDHQPIAGTATVISDVFCYGDDTGEIVVNATGGTGQLEYAISPWYNYTANNVFTTLVAGTYTIIVRDELGCEYTLPAVTVSQPATPIVATIEWENETCLNVNDGSVTISVSGGTAPYSTSMDGVTFVQDQFTYDNLGGGQHIVFVQDATGCQIIPLVFNVEDGVYINPDVSIQPVCNNGNTPGNEVIVTVAPSLEGQVEYSLDGITYQDSNIFYNLPEGDYIIYVRHENGCVKTEPFTVIFVKPISAVIITRDALCNGADSGSIIVEGSGGIGELSYGISPDFNMTPNFEFTNLTAGDYVVRVQDETGCYVDYPVTINEPEELVVTLLETLPEVCENDNNAAILISMSGGTAPYSTSLDANLNFEVGKEIYTDLDGGQTYTIYVKDANGCVTSIDVELEAPIMINAIAQVNYDCQENTLTVEVEAAVEGFVTYSLNGATPQNNNIFSNLPDGSYTVEVIHTSGCIDTTEEVTIVNNSPLTLFVTESALNEVTASASGGAGGYTYTFNGEDMGTANVFEYYASGTYEIIVTDSSGCQDIVLKELLFVDITLPDVMSPNDDGINDGWAPGNTANYPNIESYVFDRYGRKLATLKQGQEWDGRYNGVELPTGDYWYIVKLNSPENDKEYVGHFTIFR